MFSFLVGLFLFALDNTIVADVQPAIVDEFQSVDKISWLATAFFLATTGTYTPLHGIADHSVRTPIRSVFDDLPCEMVLHSHGHHLRGRKCLVRSSAKYERLDSRSCNCRSGGVR
jgi:MFS family permease